VGWSHIHKVIHKLPYSILESVTYSIYNMVLSLRSGVILLIFYALIGSGITQNGDDTNDASQTAGSDSATSESNASTGNDGEGTTNGDGTDGTTTNGEAGDESENDGEDATSGDSESGELFEEELEPIIKRTFENCTDEYRALGCPRSTHWSIQNTDPMKFGWRIFEVAFFEDEFCTVALKPADIAASDPLTCNTAYEVQYAFDSKKTTMWASRCGLDSICGFTTDTNQLLIPPYECEALEGFVSVTFLEPTQVKCVRMLQGGGHYTAKRITIRSHIGNECLTCTEGAVDVTVNVEEDGTANVDNNDSRNSTNTTSITRGPSGNSTSANTSGSSGNNTSAGDDTSSGPSEEELEVAKEAVEYEELLTIAKEDPLTQVQAARLALLKERKEARIKAEEEKHRYDDYDTMMGTPGLLGRFYTDQDIMNWDLAELDWENMEYDVEVLHHRLSFPVSPEPLNPLLTNNTFLARWTGNLRIEIPGAYEMNLMIAGRGRLLIEGEVLIDTDLNEEVPEALVVGGQHSEDVVKIFERGFFEIVIEYQPLIDADTAGLVFTWKPVNGRWAIVPMKSLMQSISMRLPNPNITYVYEDGPCPMGTWGVEFTSYEAARARCDFEIDCEAIYAKVCDNEAEELVDEFDLCLLSGTSAPSNKEGCIHKKKPKEVVDLTQQQTRAPTDGNQADALRLLWPLLWIIAGAA